jgi:prepilin-type N-terminal cleavage/methylation domain-containing protein
MRLQSNQSGFTLVEVIMVIVILGVLAAVAMKTLDSGLETSRVEETRRELDQLALAIGGNPELFSNGVRSDFGYVGDVGAMPPTLDVLVQNPGYGTWNGPYIKSDYSGFVDDYKRDAWGQTYVYSGSTTIKSIGGAPDTLTRVLVSSITDFTQNSLSCQLTDAAGNPPGDSASKVRVILSYPNGAGGIKDSVASPNKSGNITFSNCVPVGNRRIKAIYQTTNDTVQTVVSVLPRSTVQATLRFPGALWAATGTGGSGGATSMQLVPGSVVISGTNNSNLRFSIENATTSSKYITSIKVTHGKVAYYRRVIWASTTVFNNNTARAASGQIVTFTAGQPIGAYGGVVQIQINEFRSTASGISSLVNMSATPMTIEFSDGSTITFTTP